MHFSTRWSCSVSLCGLLLCGGAVVAPRRFHFTIKALTVDRISSSRTEMWRTDLLERWHSTTDVCLWRLHGSVFDFIQLSATCVAAIAESTNLNGCPYTLTLYMQKCVFKYRLKTRPGCLLMTSRRQAMRIGNQRMTVPRTAPMIAPSLAPMMVMESPELDVPSFPG